MADETRFDDPTTAAFWAAVDEGRLLVQRCDRGHHQLYPRPMCLECGGQPSWVEASGRATVYSATTCHLSIVPWLEPPYTIALVDLEEGPRLLTAILDPPVGIGDGVDLGWLETPAGAVPAFRRRPA